MLTFNDNINFDINYCQQCGTCKAVCPSHAIKFQLLENGLTDIIIDKAVCIKCKKCISVCPAAISSSIGNTASFCHKNYFLGYNTNHEIRRASSSGGVCKTLIIEGLKSKSIEGVYSLGEIKKFPNAEGRYYTLNNIPAYTDIPNSVYHPVMLGQNISRIQKCDRLLVIGTNCQLKSIEKAASDKCNKLIKICIFCKQQKTLDSTRFISKMLGINKHLNIDKEFSATYRGKGWPGTVTISTPLKAASVQYDRAAQLPFGRRLWCVPGCNICANPFGNADITLLDPWNIEKGNDLGKTLIVVHTTYGLEFISRIPNLNLEEKSFDEIAPALDLQDIYRKQRLVPYFKGESTSLKIKTAGILERFQRWYLQGIVTVLPRMPILFYRLLCKIPDLRNIILKK